MFKQGMTDKQWYSSAERSAKLRKTRQDYEKEMKGTYKQKEKNKRTDMQLESTLRKKNELSWISAKGKTSMLERALMNKGGLEKQALANKPKMAQINSRREYDRGMGRQANLVADSDEISLQYADRKARKDVNLPLDYGASSKGGKASMQEINDYIGSNFDIDELLTGEREKSKKELRALARARALQDDIDGMEINF